MNVEIDRKDGGRLLFICRLFTAGGIKSSLLSLIAEIENKYDVSVIILSEDTTDEDLSILRKHHVSIIDAGITNKLIYTPGEYYLRKRSVAKLLFKAALKVFTRLFLKDKVAKSSLKRLSLKLTNLGFDAVISYTNDIWVNGWTMPGCNYLASKVKTGQRIGWIHAELGYLGLTKENIASTYKDFDKVVCVSDACKNELINACPEIQKKVFTCHNIVDKNRIDALKNEPIDIKYKKEKVFKLITVARMELHSKRLDRIVNIARMMKMKGIPFVWYLVGDGMDYGKVRTMLEGTGLLDDVIMTGMMSNPYSYMKYSDLFVLTSDTESYGIVLAESILCGTPVVTTDFAASSEVVTDGENGYIVQKDEKVIFEKICMLINDPAELKRLTVNCNNSKTIKNDEFEKMIGA